MAKPPVFSLLLLLLLAAGRVASSRLISLMSEDPAADLLASDGISGRNSSAPFRRSEGECEQTYGFLPCTETAAGNLFLVLVFGFLMFKAATYLSSGSELLLEILGPGIVGGLLIPILGALPDALLILVSGLSGSRETAQEQVLIGMGLLAGSTVMLLTLLWGSCIVVGKCDLSENSTSIDTKDTRGFSLFGSGVTTDVQTSYVARIMTISIAPFIIVQLPKIFKFPSGERITVLIGLIVSAALVLSYCLYQIYQPWIQKRRIAYAKHKHIISGILKHAHTLSSGRLLNPDGQPNEHVIEKLFDNFDLDSDGYLTRAELRAFIIGLKFDEFDYDGDGGALEEIVNRIMVDFDTSRNDKIEKPEFVVGISNWLMEAKRTVANARSYSNEFIHDFHTKAKEERDRFSEKSDEVVEAVNNPTWTWFKAILLLLLGTVIAAVFADPLVDAVDSFSHAINVPSFFVSFIVIPLATSSETVAAIVFASRKKQRTSSLTFSQIYGGVTMNNTLCLAVFLGLVYFRGLTWDFSAEVLIILLVCAVMGIFASFRTTFRLWTCSVAYLLYPLSLVLVYVLDFVFGWS